MHLVHSLSVHKAAKRAATRMPQASTPALTLAMTSVCPLAVSSGSDLLTLTGPRSLSCLSEAGQHRQLIKSIDDAGINEIILFSNRILFRNLL